MSKVPNKVLAPSKIHKNLLANVKKESGFISADDSKPQINWVHTIMLTVTPLLAIVGLFTTTLTLPTFLFSIFMYYFTGLGITAGYHRLWSHRAFKAHWIVRLYLTIAGAGALEGSIKWWCRNHRAHHRYTDTDKDPYNARKGFWYAHMGWMLEKQSGNKIGYADISDLNRDPMVLWQHKYYPIIAIFMGFIFPTLVASLWGDAWGGYFYAGLWRVTFVHHATFCVNSLAHYFGEKTFSDLHTAFDSSFTAIITLGEGYHNYHHEFPQDYRNGIKIYHYDPTKWFVKGLSWVGLTYDLKFMSTEEIRKASAQMTQRDLDNQMAKLRYGKHFDHLPELSWEDIKSSHDLIVIEGFVHDVKNFVHEHPGGRQTLLNFVGTDATHLFNGADGAHNHSKAARQFLDAMKVGILKQTNRGA